MSDPILDPKVPLTVFWIDRGGSPFKEFHHGLKLGSDTGRFLSKSFKIE